MKKNTFLLIGLLIICFNFKAQIGGFENPIRLSTTINTDAEETMTLFFNESSTFYFSRTYDPTNTGGINDQDIWFSTLENGEFTTPQKIKELNNKLNNAILGISTDGKSLYLIDSYQGKNDQLKGISVSKKTGDIWSKPEHLNVPDIKNEGDFFGFHIDNNESIIIYSLKGTGSLGEEDLYVSKKTDNTWSTPVSMGNVINSAGYEISPFLTKSLDTLFFSSNGHGGIGDADILFSIRKDDSFTEWTTPMNLGPKVNSEKYDAFFSIIGNQGYFSSTRESEYSDIYSITILPPPPFEASLFVNLASAYGEIDLTLEGPEAPYTIAWSTGETTEDLHNLTAGIYRAVVTDKYGRKVEISFEIKSPVVEVKKVNSAFSQDQFTALIKKINPIYFDVSKYEVRKDASKELDKIIKIMNDNPTLEIELGSHTDCQSSDELNMVLSHNRAKRSAEYVKEKITNPSRINGKGYGESQLKVNCDCDATDNKSKCSKKENQLNRRTEFIMKNENSLLTEDIASTPYQTYSATPNSATTSPEKSTSSKTTKGNKKEVVVLDTDMNNKDAKTEIIEVTTTTPEKTATKNTEEEKGATKFRTDITVTFEQQANIDNGFYILQEGETLYRASINSKVSIAELRRINNLKSNNVYPGTKLLLK